MIIAMGTKIRELRNEKGLTLYELADKSDISDRQLSNIELGIANAKITTLVSIANALGTYVGYFLGEPGAKKDRFDIESIEAARKENYDF